MKFNLKEALAAKGFTPIVDPFGCAAYGQLVQKVFEREVNTHRGIVKYSLTVTARFTSDDQALTVSYADQGRKPFKTKTHFSDRRAYRAIENTLLYHGYEL